MKDFTIIMRNKSLLQKLLLLLLLLCLPNFAMARKVDIFAKNVTHGTFHKISANSIPRTESLGTEFKTCAASSADGDDLQCECPDYEEGIEDVAHLHSATCFCLNPFKFFSIDLPFNWVQQGHLTNLFRPPMNV